MAENDAEWPKLTPEQIKIIEDVQVGSGEFADPAAFVIPEEAISNWTAIPEGQNVVLSLTRKDMDHFFFFGVQQNAAVALLQNALQTLSRNDVQGATAYFTKSQILNASAEANFRKFFAAIMRGVTPSA